MMIKIYFVSFYLISNKTQWFNLFISYKKQCQFMNIKLLYIIKNHEVIIFIEIYIYIKSNKQMMNETVNLFTTLKAKSRIQKKEQLFATIKHLPKHNQQFSQSASKVSSLASFKHEKTDMSIIGQNKLIRKMFTEQSEPLQPWNISNIRDFKREIEMLDCDSFNTSLRLKLLQKNQHNKTIHRQIIFNDNKRQKSSNNIQKKTTISKIGIRRNSETIEKKTLGTIYKENIRPHTKVTGSRKLMHLLVNKLEKDLFKNSKRTFDQQKLKNVLKDI